MTLTSSDLSVIYCNSIGHRLMSRIFDFEKMLFIQVVTIFLLCFKPMLKILHASARHHFDILTGMKVASNVLIYIWPPRGAMEITRTIRHLYVKLGYRSNRAYLNKFQSMSISTHFYASLQCLPFSKSRFLSTKSLSMNFVFFIIHTDQILFDALNLAVSKKDLGEFPIHVLFLIFLKDFSKAIAPIAAPRPVPSKLPSVSSINCCSNRQRRLQFLKRLQNPWFCKTFTMLPLYFLAW